MLEKPANGSGASSAGPADQRAVPPTSEELEVSLLGPGYGECVVLHFGGAWVVVDSCIDIRTRRPVALEYLQTIGVDPSDIRLVVATHWHDDHIRGLAEILRRAEKARFVVSTALRSKELLTLVSLMEPRMLQRSSGVSELAQVYEHLAATGDPPTFATADRRIWRPAGKLARELWSLAPSDRSIELALHGVRSLLQDTELPNRRVPELRPNDASIVLWGAMADTAVLLGGDLEECGDPLAGWRVIVASTTRPSGTASVFKVPHHGSANGHSDEVWEEMLDADVIGVLTPFARGRTRLPTAADRRRIGSLTSSAYITADRPAATAHWPPAVAATLAEATTAIHDAEPPPGHVRLRRRVAAGPWQVELFGGATSL